MANPGKKLVDDVRIQSGAQADNYQLGPGLESKSAQNEESRSPQYSIFTTWQKRAIVLAGALGAFFSPFSGQIYLPSLPSIARDLDVSISQINLTVTTFVAVQALTPMFIGSFADNGGRRPTYVICFCVYITACVGLALVPNYGGVMALRCLQSAGSSSLPVLYNAVISDIATSAERSTYSAFSALPAVFGPALGPVIGGLLSQSFGWRSIFWFLAILAATYLLPLITFFPETCRRVVHDGSVTPPWIYQSLWQVIRLRKETTRRKGPRGPTPDNGVLIKKFKFRMPNPLGSIYLLFQRETGMLCGSGSMTMVGVQVLAVAMSTKLPLAYGLSETQVGLMYLPFAGGVVIAAGVAGPAMTWNFKRHCAKQGISFDKTRQMDLSNFPIEKARLEVGIPLLLLGSTALLGWAWAINNAAHLAVLGVLSMLQGVGLTGYGGTVNALLADIHPGRVGTAMAANNLIRGLLGAAATAAISPMIRAMGIGWSGTMFVILPLAFVPGLLLVMFKGMEWRAQLVEKRKHTAKEERPAADSQV